MTTKKLNHLGVIEIPYGDLNWGPDPLHIREGIYSDIQHWKKYRELDDYKLCGIYGKAGVPYSVEEIVYDPEDDEEVYLTLTRQVSDSVFQHLSNKEAVLLTGGYCKDAVGVCGGIQRAIGADKKVGIIYLDAHSDMSTPRSPIQAFWEVWIWLQSWVWTWRTGVLLPGWRFLMMTIL